MPEYSAEFTIETDILIDQSLEILEFSPPSKSFSIVLKNTEAVDPIELNAIVSVSTDSIAEADKKARQALSEFLGLLAWVSNTSYSVKFQKNVVEWPPAKKEVG